MTGAVFAVYVKIGKPGNTRSGNGKVWFEGEIHLLTEQGLQVQLALAEMVRGRPAWLRVGANWPVSMKRFLST
jgi:hypothetical protein